MNFIDFLRCVPTDSTLKQFMIGHGLTVSGDCILSADMVVAEIERVSCIQKRSRIIAELTLAARLASVTQVEALRRAAGHDAQVASGLAACTNNEHRSLWLLVHHRDLFDAACSNAGVVSFFEQAQPMDMQVWMPLQSGDGVFLKLQTVKVLTLTESPGIGLAASNEAVASGPLPIRAADAVAELSDAEPVANIDVECATDGAWLRVGDRVLRGIRGQQRDFVINMVNAYRKGIQRPKLEWALRMAGYSDGTCNLRHISRRSAFFEFFAQQDGECWIVTELHPVPN